MRAAWLVASLTLVLGGCESVPESSPSCPAQGPFVTAAGDGLCLDGRPFRFLGANRYDVLSSSRFSCGRSYDDAALDRLGSELAASGVRVLRTWAFATFTDGGRDFASLDRLIAVARRYGIRLVLTLENEWQDCSVPDGATADGRKGPAWFTSGWRTSLQPHLEAIVARYRDEPQILAWQIMNEAESPDAAALLEFARATSTLVKSIDSNHLVSLGTIGTGQAGTTGDDYVRLHELTSIDLVEAHDYHEERSALPSQIAADFAVARRLGKPFFIGESGIAAPSPPFAFAYEERARLFDAKLRAAFVAGVSGYLVWSFYDLSTANPQGWDFGPDDPLAGVLASIASTL